MFNGLQGKNILFITPEFFGIEKCLIRAMEEFGANVYWFNERSVNSSIARAINSILPCVFNRHSNDYFKRIVDELNVNIDIILIVKGDMVSKVSIDYMRKKWKNAPLILYLWDPVINIKGIESKLQFYDKVISFEPKDCQKYGFEFRALFSDIEYDNTSEKNDDYVYDIAFYGTMYADRFAIIHDLDRYCLDNKRKFYRFCYLRGKFMKFFYFLTNKGFRKLGSKAISYTPKSSSEIAEIISSSKSILDINDPLQEGLTLRTLETLSMGKKMITTNSDIKNYDFYNPNNICVISRTSIDIPRSFFEDEYENIDSGILEKYTAKGWVRDVFSMCSK